MSIPQMRTAEQVFNYIKEQDPNTAISTALHPEVDP